MARTKEQILRYVPKSKLAAIYDAWEDSDGMWIMLNDGWNADRMDYNCHTIHEYNVTDLRYQIAGIRQHMRTISVGVPSGKLKLTLWDGTEDAEQFVIHGISSDKPYVKAYGKLYPLTPKEIKLARQMAGAAKSVNVDVI